MTKKIAAVVAHADDEILGVGGTLARHIADGDDVTLIYMADGVSSRGAPDAVTERNAAAHAAANALGGATQVFLGLPDNAMDQLTRLEIIQCLEKVLAEIKPQIIYTHHASDLNVDHRLTTEAVLTACRPMPGSQVESIFAFETLSSTEWAAAAPHNAFVPQHYVDISKNFEKKMAALKAYDLEMRDFPHARSFKAVEAQATLRGAHVGLAQAEAFMVLRQIIF